MVKTILYTSNPKFAPSNFSQIQAFAEENNKYLVCYVGEDNKLFNVAPQAHVVSSRGNNIYVLNVMDGQQDAEELGAKVSNFTAVSIDYPFGKKTSDRKDLSIKNFSQRIKDAFMPQEAEDVRIAMDGNICVATKNGYVAINENNELISYPTEMTIDLPVFSISKPMKELVPGDIIVRDHSYAKVTKISDNKITAIGYTGSGALVHPIKDFLLGQTTVRVLMSLAGNINQMGMNPMILALMTSSKKDKSFDSLIPLMMMSQNGGNLSANPAMMLALAGGDGLDAKSLLMMSYMNGGNMFGNLFNAPKTTPLAKATPVKVATPVKQEIERIDNAPVAVEAGEGEVNDAD